MPFATTYLCESRFSSLLQWKHKYQSCFNTSNNLHVSLSNCVPRYEQVISVKQQQNVTTSLSNELVGIKVNTFGALLIDEYMCHIFKCQGWWLTHIYVPFNRMRWVRIDAYICLFFFTETFRSFFAETFWSLKHFGHLSHGCIKTLRNNVLAYIFRHSDWNDFFSVISKSFHTNSPKTFELWSWAANHLATPRLPDFFKEDI